MKSLNTLLQISMITVFSCTTIMPMNVQDSHKKHMLKAVVEGDVETVQSLLEAKANPNDRDPIYNYPLLVNAVDGTLVRADMPLLKEDPTPEQQEAVARLLLAHKADVNACGGPGGNRNALHASLLFCNPSHIKLLLENKVDVHHRSTSGRNALVETLNHKGVNGALVTHLILTHPETNVTDVHNAYSALHTSMIAAMTSPIFFTYDQPEYSRKRNALTNARIYAYECSRIELRELLKKITQESGLNLVSGVIVYIADYAALHHNYPAYEFPIKEYSDKSTWLIPYQG